MLKGWNLQNSYAELPGIFFTRLDPTPVRAPQLMMWNERLAAELGLMVEHGHIVAEDTERAQLFAGNRTPPGGVALAQAYAGHQFGHFTMLGDGRAIVLGEQVTPTGQRYDIQLKGSGRTPYSRSGDGRAALGPMLREYVISEAMVALGIPTTRSLAVCTTGEMVIRETELLGAVLTRVASSHLRVGTFEFAAANGLTDELRELTEYAIHRHFSDLDGRVGVSGSERYAMFLEDVIARQASLIARWQAVGFVHGVMNTDNMAISGETIDYGPCAFMDVYHPATVFSSIDRQGRYAYGNQPRIAAWNLTMLARALVSLLADEMALERQVSFAEGQEMAVRRAQAAIDRYGHLYRENRLRAFRAKLGLADGAVAEWAEQDEALIDDLLDLMEKNRADFTNTFVALTKDEEYVGYLFETADFAVWRERWRTRLRLQMEYSGETEADIRRRMQAANPLVIPRNQRVEEALTAAVEDGDYSLIYKLLQVLAHPYDYERRLDAYYTEPVQAVRPYRTFCGT